MTRPPVDPIDPNAASPSDDPRIEEKAKVLADEFMGLGALISCYKTHEGESLESILTEVHNSGLTLEEFIEGLLWFGAEAICSLARACSRPIGVYCAEVAVEAYPLAVGELGVDRVFRIFGAKVVGLSDLTSLLEGHDLPAETVEAVILAVEDAIADGEELTTIEVEDIIRCHQLGGDGSGGDE